MAISGTEKGVIPFTTAGRALLDAGLTYKSGSPLDGKRVAEIERQAASDPDGYVEARIANGLIECVRHIFDERAKVRQLRDALIKYGGHKIGCMGDCCCGLDEVLTIGAPPQSADV